MAFRERIELIVDVVTGNSSGGLKDLSSEIEKTDGAFGKAKTAASGAFDHIKQNAANFAMAGGAALAGFAIKAVGDFQETALGAGALRDSLGVTSEEASRLQEVAGDLGIGVGALETSIGRMNKTAATSPEAFDEIGAAIARNKDGTTNTTETYLNVIDALNRIEDPAKRAAAAQKILGKSWMDSAELIQLGADGVRTAMASVEEAKIIDDNEVARAREFRDTLDGLKGVLESVSITVGQELVPMLSDAGQAIQSLVGPLQDVKGAYEDITGAPVIKQVYENVAPWESWRTRIDQVGDAFNAVTGKSDDMQSSYNQAASEAAHLAKQQEGVASVTDDLTGVVGGLIPAVDEATDSTMAATVQSGLLKEAQESAARAAEKHAEALQDEADQLSDTAGAFADAADLALDLEDAQKAVMEAAGDSEASLGDLTRAVRDAAQAEADHAVAAFRAEGAVLSQSQALDINNASLVRQASQLKGPQRQAILDYIGSVNGIPPEKMSEISAFIDNGSINEANGALNGASRSRDALIRAEAATSQAERDLANLTRDRNVRIIANQVVNGPRHSGGQIPRFAGGGQVALVGEHGPELVGLPGGAQVMNQSETKRMVAGAGGGNMVNVTVNMPPGSDGRDLVRQLRRYERSNGPGWRTS